MAVEWKIVMSLGRAMSTQEMCNYNKTSENKRNDLACSPAFRCSHGDGDISHIKLCTFRQISTPEIFYVYT